MYIFKNIQALQGYLNQQKEQEKEIGFVPTMGALHFGHLALLQKALPENDLVVCSIYVNPKQFGEATDLDLYPRPIESDIEKLEKLGCQVLFLPSTAEIYPPDLESPNFDLAGLDQGMEGAHRPGHFAGVVQVVHRLLDIVRPNDLYMGQKDYQQFAIIKHMLTLMQSPIKLHRVPIIREENGLAMSSRNIRLSTEGRKKATQISKTLFQAKVDAQTLPLLEVKQKALDYLAKHQMEVDYFEVIDGNSLQPIQSFDQAAIVTACTTVRVDGIRLLDNIILKEIEVPQKQTKA